MATLNDSELVAALKEDTERGFRLLMAKYKEAVYWHVRRLVVSHEDVSAAETGGHAALAPFLKEHGVEALIAGGIGGGARTALANAGITLYPGVVGSADKAAKALAEGTLEYDENATCHHHEGEHTCGHGHSC